MLWCDGQHWQCTIPYSVNPAKEVMFLLGVFMRAQVGTVIFYYLFTGSESILWCRPSTGLHLWGVWSLAIRGGLYQATLQVEVEWCGSYSNEPTRLPLHRESQSINGPIQERTRPCWTVQISEVTPRWTEADVCSQHEYSTHTRYFVLWCPVLILVWSIDRMFFNRFVQVPAYSPLYIKGECSSHSQTGGGSLYSLRWLLGSVCR